MSAARPPAGLRSALAAPSLRRRAAARLPSPRRSTCCASRPRCPPRTWPTSRGAAPRWATCRRGWWSWSWRRPSRGGWLGGRAGGAGRGWGTGWMGGAAGGCGWLGLGARLAGLSSWGAARGCWRWGRVQELRAAGWGALGLGRPAPRAGGAGRGLRQQAPAPRRAGAPLALPPLPPPPPTAPRRLPLPTPHPPPNPPPPCPPPPPPRSISEFSGQTGSNIVWALATLGLKPSRALLETLAHFMAAHAGKEEALPQHLANTVGWWGCSRAGLQGRCA
jgi:hypothetical protein